VGYSATDFSFDFTLAGMNKAGNCDVQKC